MKKCIKICAIILAVLALMFAEYRFIMRNLCPYVSEDTVYIELLGQTDAYDLEWSD